MRQLLWLISFFSLLGGSLWCGGPAQAQGGQSVGFTELAAGKAKSPSSAVPGPLTQRFEQEGIAIDFSISPLGEAAGQTAELVAGADALVSFRLSDARTGEPLTGLHPNAWISARLSKHRPNEAECKDKIRTFLGGLLSVRPELDLNKYLALTLNHDNTISVINPQVSFSRTKLESLIVLPGPGADWVLSANKDFLYVTLPEQSAVAVIDTITRKLTQTIATGDKTRPMRVALQPDGRALWVGLDGSAAVAVLDTATNKLSATVAVGTGLHNIAFTADSRFAYVTNSTANTVSVLDTGRLTKLTDLAVGQTPVPVAYSKASQQIYVAAINGAAITVINPATQEVVGTIPAKRGIVALSFEPTGRFGLAINQRENLVLVLDSATNRLIGETEVVKSPDQVVFSNNYAYIRGVASEKFSLLDLKTLAKGKLTPVDVVAGQKAASTLPAEVGVAAMIAPAPEGNAALIANTPDQMLYYYVEGMMAPIGTITNYKRRPQGVLILDRSLAEQAPGVYATPIKLPQAGPFDVSVLLNQPRLSHCFSLEVAASPAGEVRQANAAVVVESLFKGMSGKVGEAMTLKFKLTDSITKQPITGLADLQVLLFEPPGVWQQRQWAKEVGAGIYELSAVFPRPGFYNVMVGIASRGLRFADLPPTAVTIVAP